MKMADALEKLGVNPMRAEQQASGIAQYLDSNGIGEPEQLVIALSLAATAENEIRRMPNGVAVAEMIREFCEQARKHLLETVG